MAGFSRGCDVPEGPAGGLQINLSEKNDSQARDLGASRTSCACSTEAPPPMGAVTIQRGFW